MTYFDLLFWPRRALTSRGQASKTLYALVAIALGAMGRTLMASTDPPRHAVAWKSLSCFRPIGRIGTLSINKSLPYQSAAMRQALDKHCSDYGIGHGTMLCLAVEQRIRFLVGIGVVTDAALSTALQADRVM